MYVAITPTTPAPSSQITLCAGASPRSIANDCSRAIGEVQPFVRTTTSSMVAATALASARIAGRINKRSVTTGTCDDSVEATTAGRNFPWRIQRDSRSSNARAPLACTRLTAPGCRLE